MKWHYLVGLGVIAVVVIILVATTTQHTATIKQNHFGPPYSCPQGGVISCGGLGPVNSTEESLCDATYGPGFYKWAKENCNITGFDFG
jgi:hypothetical protein